jgi:integrase
MAGKRKRKGEGDKGAYGSGSIYPNKDGSFTVQIYIHGKLVRRRAPNREAAEALKAELNRQKAAKIDIREGSQPVEQFTNYWFHEVYLQRDIKPRTAKHTLDMLQWYILPVIGARPLNAVLHTDLQTLLNDLRRRPKPLKPLSTQTVRHVHRVICDVFTKAHQIHLIYDNPSLNLEVPKIRRVQKEALTIAQVRALFAVVEGTRYGAAFHTMALLGLRIGETLALRRIDFNADFSEVTIRRAIGYHSNDMGTPKSDSAARRLPIPPRLSDMLKAQWAHIKEQQHDPASHWKEHGLIFPSEVGTAIQPRNFERAWSGQNKKVKRKGVVEHVFFPGFKQQAGLPDKTVLHDLRRFLATLLEDLDVGQRTIGHILGHAAGNVTEVYIKRNMPTMRRALEKVEQAIWGAQAERMEREG